MIGRLNHVAIAVRDIAKAAALYRDTLGAEVSAAEPQREHGVTTVFITLPNTKIELLEPLGQELADRKIPRTQPGRRHSSPVLRGRRYPRGARCPESRRARVCSATANRRQGAHGKPVLFLHPKDFYGTLIELEQA